MVRLLPAHPSLEQLKNQAKDLIAAYRRGEPDARARLQRWFPDQDGASGGPLSPAPGAPPTSGVAARTLRLSNAQLTIAREHGFPSWARLAAWVAREELPDDLATQVELLGVRSWRVVRAATDALNGAGAAGVAAAIVGLSHPSPRVRRGAADFMDHHADDSCVAKLADLALHDPVPYVRRTAVHALLCQRCKPAPLTTDVVPWLMHVAREDPSHRVRLSALWGLGQQGRDTRVVEMLSTFLRQEDDLSLRSAAHQALRRQSPEYRQETAQRARAASMATREAELALHVPIGEVEERAGEGDPQHPHALPAAAALAHLGDGEEGEQHRERPGRSVPCGRPTLDYDLSRYPLSSTEHVVHPESEGNLPA